MHTTPRTAATGGFRRDIQGLRAVAVLLVLLEHAHLGVSGGYIGVDVFFVISGFLITGHLIRELDRRGRIDLAAFWARRVRRILPAAVTVGLVTTLAALAPMPPLIADDLGKTAVAALLSVPNLLFAAQGTNYLAGNAPSPFQHYWSLGVEEQFYLVWPLLLLLLWWLGRRVGRTGPMRVVTLGIAAVVIASAVLSVVLTAVSQPWAFFSLPTRAWELALGGLVAVAVSRRVVVPARWSALLGWLALAILVVSALLYDAGTTYPGVAALVPATAAAALVWAGTADGGRGPVLLLRLRPLQYLGRVSYSLYLWHWPLLVIPQAAIGLATPLPLWSRVGAVLVALVLADVTTRCIEGPLRTARATASSLRVVLTGTAASAAAVLVVLAALPVVDQRPLSTDRDAADVVPSTAPVFTDFVPADLEPSLRSASSSGTTINRNGCHINERAEVAVNDCVLGDAEGTRTVALVGDSHAAHWFPALERWAGKVGDVRLLAYTKAGCPVVDVTVRLKSTAFHDCDTWRAGVVEKLDRVQPDVILLSNASRFDLVSDQPRAAAWSDGLRRLLGELPTSSRVTVLADTPDFPESVPRCASATLDDLRRCGVARADTIDADWQSRERAATDSAGHTYRDLTDWFCDADRCGVVSGTTLMYRDQGHLTEEWSASLWKPIGEAVAAAR